MLRHIYIYGNIQYAILKYIRPISDSFDTMICQIYYLTHFLTFIHISCHAFWHVFYIHIQYIYIYSDKLSDNFLTYIPTGLQTHGGFHKWGTPKWMVYSGQNPIDMDNLGVPHFRKPPLSWEDLRDIYPSPRRRRAWDNIPNGFVWKWLPPNVGITWNNDL